MQRVIAMMRERYSEPLGLDDLARTAMMSKFHFLRTFRDTTGVTPGRFLSAIRIHEAKQLLLLTSLNVSDVSVRVGYSSTGSFTRRFTNSVGCSPARYRCPRARSASMKWLPSTSQGPTGRSFGGRIQAASQPGSAIFVGLFDGPMLERSPFAQTWLDAPGTFSLVRPTAGRWWLHAAAYAPVGSGPERSLLVESRELLASDLSAPGGPLLTLHSWGWTDPPPLLELPDLDRARVFAA